MMNFRFQWHFSPTEEIDMNNGIYEGNIPIHAKKVTIKIEYNMSMEYSKSNGGGPGFLLLIEYVNSIWWKFLQMIYVGPRYSTQ